MEVRVPLRYAKMLRGVSEFFKYLHEILTYKYNNYKYIPNYFAHDYRQGLLDSKILPKGYTTKKGLRTTALDYAYVWRWQKSSTTESDLTIREIAASETLAWANGGLIIKLKIMMGRLLSARAYQTGNLF